MRIAPAVRIGKHIQLQLPDAVVQLLCQWRMAIVQRRERSGIVLLQQRCFAGCEAGVVTVMASDVLQIGEPRLCLRRHAGEQ